MLTLWGIAPERQRETGDQIIMQNSPDCGRNPHTCHQRRATHMLCYLEHNVRRKCCTSG